MNSVLNINVSCFENYSSPNNPKTVNLLKWLTSDKYADKVKAIRNTQDKEIRDLMKSGLPAITVSGTFTRRSENDLIKHSGLISFDIDRKDNLHISNYDELKAEIQKIPTVAYVGLSVSGTGYWGIMPIAYPDKHKQHFESMRQFFAKHGLVIDAAPKNTSSLRGYSSDPDAYFNHNAEPLKVYQEELKANINKPVYHSDDTETVEHIIKEISTTDITDDYGVWFAIGCDLAGVFGASGESYFHDISRNHPKYNSKESATQFNACLKFMRGKSANLGALINACKDYSIPTKRTVARSLGNDEPICLFIKQIIDAPCETITTFEDMRLLYVRTPTGTYDLLFDTNGNPVSEITAPVKELAELFEKKFQKGYLDNEPALIHKN